jgi:hypothetical protein
MGGCCAATRYNLNANNMQGFPARITYENDDLQFNHPTFNL